MSASFETVRASYDALAESERQAALERMSRSALELGLMTEMRCPKVVATSSAV